MPVRALAIALLLATVAAAPAAAQSDAAPADAPPAEAPPEAAPPEAAQPEVQSSEEAITGRPPPPSVEAVDPSRFSGRPADAAYGAYQRGYYLTALELATPLALDGNAAAQTLVAEIYSRGLGVPRDVAKAVEWYEKAAAQKVPEAIFQLAMILLDGGEQFGDPDRAYELMREAADAGNRMAQFNYAQMVIEREPSRMARAVEYYERAAKQGLADAQYAMAQVYEFGVGGRKPDPAEARRWLEEAAQQNFETAQIELATKLIEGVGGERDLEAGFGWMMRAASAGNPAAQNRLAKLYRGGLGVEPDSIEAAAWYLRARRAGLVDDVMEDHLAGLTDKQLKEAATRAASL